MTSVQTLMMPPAVSGLSFSIFVCSDSLVCLLICFCFSCWFDPQLRTAVHTPFEGECWNHMLVHACTLISLFGVSAFSSCVEFLTVHFQAFSLSLCVAY
jgi:hypothetical protein